MSTQSVTNKLFQEFKNSPGNPSFVFSPYSIHYAMGMMYRGMGGISKQEFENLYQIKNGDAYIDSLAVVNHKLNNPYLKTANSIFLHNTFNLLDTYVAFVNSSDFNTQICDFENKPEEETQVINSWVSDNTNGLIPNILPQTLPVNTKLVLVNTVYFKQGWCYPFEFERGETFTKLNGDTVKETMMSGVEETLEYFENDEIQMVLLPYKANTLHMPGPFSFGIILPKEGVSLSDDYDITQLVSSCSREKVNVTIPRFETEFETDLCENYEAMGLRSIFNGLECNLSRLTSDYKGLSISNIIHRAKIIVDKNGTEAAATTALLIDELCCMEPINYFKANRTFQHFIIHRSTNTVLFSGVFNGA